MRAEAKRFSFLWCFLGRMEFCPWAPLSFTDLGGPKRETRGNYTKERFSGTRDGSNVLITPSSFTQGVNDERVIRTLDPCPCPREKWIGFLLPYEAFGPVSQREMDRVSAFV
jgi:hypothetical protein